MYEFSKRSKIGVFPRKMDGFFWQKNPIFRNIDEGSKLAVERDRIGKISQNVQVLIFLKKKQIGFQKETIFSKIVELSKISVEGDWISDFSQHVQKLRFRKQDWLIGKKSWVSLKTAKSSHSDAECNRISMFSLSVQKERFLLKKKDVFSRNFLIVLKSLKVANWL